jgi:general secretion pathway protein I
MRSRLIARRGFTLIEGLAAFAILALTLTQLLSALGGATTNESRADFLLRATRQGQSQLDSLGLDAPIAQGETSGAYEDGLLWTLTVEPHRTVKSPLSGTSVASYWAQLAIRRPSAPGAKRESITLTALKLVEIREQQR